MKLTRVKRNLSIFLWATLAALSVRLFLLEDYRVFSDSMAPELFSGDLVFVSKAGYSLRLPFSSFELVKLRSPKRGEVVAFVLPDQGWQTYIKRIVAVEGDEVLVRDGIVYINGQPAQYRDGEGDLRWESIDGSPGYPIHWQKSQIPNYGPVQVPEKHFFVMGDNRIKSVDSRTWGPIPYSCLKGKVSLIWLSLTPEGGLRRERIGRWVRS